VHPGGVTRVAFSPDGTLFFTLGMPGDEQLRLLRTVDQKPIGQPIPCRYGASAFSPDSKLVIAAGPDKTVRFFEKASGKGIGLPMAMGIDPPVFSPDGKWLATGDPDLFAVRLWEVRSGKPIAGPLSQFAFSPDGRFLLTVSNQRTVRLWEAATGRAIGRPLSHPDQHTHVSFSPDGLLVRTITTNRTARFWDAATGALLGLPSPVRWMFNSRPRAPTCWRGPTAGTSLKGEDEGY
jgi:WD40 repeat protein